MKDHLLPALIQHHLDATATIDAATKERDAANDKFCVTYKSAKANLDALADEIGEAALGTIKAEGRRVFTFRGLIVIVSRANSVHQVTIVEPEVLILDVLP